MLEQVMMWTLTIDLVLLVVVLACAPRAIRLSSEAEYLGKKAMMLHAEIEQEKLARGVSEADYYRTLREHLKRLDEMYLNAQRQPQHPPH